MNRSGRRIRNPRFLALVWVLVLVAVVCVTGGMEDPDPGLTRAQAGPGWIPWLALAVFAWLSVRAWFVGVTVDGDQLIRHGWWGRRHAYSRNDIRGVRAIPYSGWLLPYPSGGTVTMVALDLSDGRRVKIPELPGFGGTPRRLAARLRLLCGLDPDPQEPRHVREP